MQVPPSTTLQYISMYIMKSGLLLYKCILYEVLQTTVTVLFPAPKDTKPQNYNHVLSPLPTKQNPLIRMWKHLIKNTDLTKTHTWQTQTGQENTEG